MPFIEYFIAAICRLVLPCVNKTEQRLCFEMRSTINSTYYH
jgi:hypothetical protein